MPITGFKVYRNGSLIASPTSSPFTDTGLTNGQSYSYQVSAVSEAGEGPKSATVTAVPAAVVPPSGNSVTVSSIGALKQALANNNLDEIVVVNGTYAVNTAASQQANSLWIGSAYASRTRDILVRAQTDGGVTFDGGNATYFGGITFTQGAHHQTWQGFKFAHGTATETGVIVFGGYAGYTAPHHITLKNITLMDTLLSHTPVGVSNDHGIYFSEAATPGVHDILIDGLVCNALPGTTALDSVIHFYHSDPGNPNASNVTIRNVQIQGTDMAIILWDPTISNIVLEDVTVNGASQFAVRYEKGGTVTLRRFTSTNSGAQGFYSSLGANPPGVTKIDCSFDT